MKLGPSVPLPDRRCPWCGETLNMAASFDHDQQPKPGDLTVCIQCAGMLKYGPAMKLLRLTEADIDDLDDETADSLALAHQTIREFIAQRRRS